MEGRPRTSTLLFSLYLMYSLILNGKVVFIMCNQFCILEKDCPNCDSDCEFFDYHLAILDEQLSNFYDSVL